MAHYKSFYLNIVHIGFLRIEDGLAYIDLDRLFVRVTIYKIGPDISSIILCLRKPQCLIRSGKNHFLQRFRLGKSYIVKIDLSRMTPFSTFQPVAVNRIGIWIK